MLEILGGKAKALILPGTDDKASHPRSKEVILKKPVYFKNVSVPRWRRCSYSRSSGAAKNHRKTLQSRYQSRRLPMRGRRARFLRQAPSL